MIGYFCFEDTTADGLIVVPADGSTHAIGAQIEPEDGSGYVIAQQVSGEVFVDPAGTQTSLTATSQSPTLVYSGSPGQAKVSIPAPVASPGFLTANFTYSGQPNGTSDYGADPVYITFEQRVGSRFKPQRRRTDRRQLLPVLFGFLVRLQLLRTERVDLWNAGPRILRNHIHGVRCAVRRHREFRAARTGSDLDSGDGRPV